METRDATRDFTETARAALVRGEVESAINWLRRALTNDAGSAEAHALLSRALLREHRVAGALHEGRAAVAIAPDSSEALQALGHALVAAKKPVEAGKRFAEARRIDPGSVGALRGLAALAKQDQHERAVSLLEQGLEIEPENVDALVDLGDTFLAGGLGAEARVAAERARANDPERVDALLLMGRIHLRQGDLAAAREHAVQALREERGSVAAIGLLASIKARESFALGVWFRMNAALAELGPRWVLVLATAFLGSRIAVLLLEDLGQPRAASLASWVWIAFCAYTWIAPSQFASLMRRELEQTKPRR